MADEEVIDDIQETPADDASEEAGPEADETKETPTEEEGKKSSFATEAAAEEAKSEGDESDDGEPKEEDEQEGEGKGDEDGGSDEGAPEEYADFTLPEELKLEGDRLNAAQEFFKANNWTQEQAQSAIDFYSGLEVKRAEEVLVQRREKIESWREDVEKDEVLGGEHLKRTKAATGRTLRAFDVDDKFSELLNTTGLGNHPTMVKFLTAVGLQIQEDSGGGKGDGPSKNPLDAMFPTMAKSD